jgi:TetR/AcrR family transcriptional repressor of nem operon
VPALVPRNLCLTATLDNYVAGLANDVAGAKARYAAGAPRTAEGVAAHVQAVLQGRPFMAGARQGPAVAVESLGHPSRDPELSFKR